MRKSILFFGIAIAACAPQTIIVDPSDNPAVFGGAATAQPLPPPPGMPPGMAPEAPLPPLPVLKADFLAKAGSDTVRFELDAWLLDDSARTTLAAQAAWLRLNPMVRANIEGHADGRMTREHALALGERRAAAVQSFLISQGVPPEQLSVTSWGKERPAVEGAHEATFLQNSRVVTTLVRPEPAPFMPPPPPQWGQ